MDNEKCRALIRLYGTKDFLWNSKVPNFHNKSLREDAWREMAAEIGIPVSEIKKKMTTLLSSYRREKSRDAKSLITGSGSDDIYKSKWYAFEDFEFMKDKNTPFETTDTMADDAITEAHENYFEETPCVSKTVEPEKEATIHTPEPIKLGNLKKKGTKRRPNPEEQDPMLKKAFVILEDSSSTSRDQYFTYGQNIGNEWRKYNPRTLTFVKQAINNIIFEADLGKYDNLDYVMRDIYENNTGDTIQTPSPQLSTPTRLTPSPYPEQLSVSQTQHFERGPEEANFENPEFKHFKFAQM